MDNNLRSYEKIMHETYISVIFNWAQIQTNQSILNILDMNTNSMCQYIKRNNPTLRDEFVQARVFTMLLMMIIGIASPIRSIFNNNGDGDVDLMRNSDELFNEYEPSYGSGGSDDFEGFEGDMSILFDFER